MNKQWLLEYADIPIQYILSQDSALLDQFFNDEEIRYWFSKIKARSDEKNLEDVHGSHDYRLENILGKCWILGFSKNIPEFDLCITYILEFLKVHIHRPKTTELSFAVLYSSLDYETVLACYLPFLGYGDVEAVRYIANKRINILYDFTKQKRYDIFVDSSKFKGVKKEWQPYMVNPDLYSDGNIALPTIRDFILFAGMFDQFDKNQKNKVETIAEWIFSDWYKNIPTYGYFYVPGGLYNAKSMVFKINLLDFSKKEYDDNDLKGLLFTVYIFSFFESARISPWFRMAKQYLDSFITVDNRYLFSKAMITEKPDQYVFSGGHMNIGENKKSKLYQEIVSTYWMEKLKSQF